jgi:hypothetical protein
MKIPFHTENCREGWGCRTHCPVLLLVKEYEKLVKDLETTQKETKQ